MHIKGGKKNALQAFEAYCFVEPGIPVPALQLRLNFRAYWMFSFSLLTAAPITSLMKVHCCSTVPGSVGTACTRMCVVCTVNTHACRRVLCMYFHVSRHIIQGHSHAARRTTHRVQKSNHVDSILGKCYGTAAAAAHAATDIGG